MREVAGIYHLGNVRETVEVVAHKIEVLERLAQLLEVGWQLHQAISLDDEILEMSQFADVFTKLHIAYLVVVVACQRECLEILQVLHFLRKHFARLQIEHAELDRTYTA